MIVDRSEALIRAWTSGPDFGDFPALFHAQCFDQYEFWQVLSHAELRDETINMRCCIARAARGIAEGHLCAVSVRRDGARVASVLVALTPAGHRDVGNQAFVARGYAGKTLPAVEDVVRSWLASQDACQLPPA
jgi:hypothetical protein